MEELELLLREIDVSKFEINTDHWVDVTQITNPHNFYVRPTKYRTFIQKLEMIKPTTKASCVDVHDLVIYNMDQTGKEAKFARGKIFYIVDGHKYEILAVDYGYYHKSILLENVWECNQELSKIPPLALNCQLGMCAVLGGKAWTQGAIDAFIDYVGNERAKIIITDKKFDKLVVELINSCPDDIATLMALTGYSTLGYVHNAINRFTTITPKITPTQISYLIFKNININETLHVRVQSGKSLDAFYVAEVNDYQNYLKEYDNMQYYANKEPTLTEEKFKLHTAVCLKNYIGKYERAIITNITVPDTKAKVKLLDWGKEEEGHILKMKPIPERYLKIPVLAIYCSACDKQVWDNELHRILHPGFEFLMQIKQLGKEFESPNIVKIIPLQGSSSIAPPGKLY